MERGELPFKQINWLQDEDGYYFNIRTDTGIYDIRPENTAIFRFGNSDLDHIYRITEDEGDRFMGFRLYRYQLEDKGYNFDQVCSDMMDRDFDSIYDEEPNQEEIDAYINAGNEYTPTPKVDTIDNIVALAMKNLDTEWAYWGEEWSNGQA